MIKKTRWRPDTCGCEIEYEWDDSLSQEKRVHTPSQIIKKCEFHQDMLNKNEHYTKVLEENQTKNRVWGKLLEISTLTADKVSEDGETHKELKPNITYNWSFDADRNLVVDMPLSAKEKNDLRGKVSEFIKVIIK
jgi:hypothetical protein